MQQSCLLLFSSCGEQVEAGSDAPTESKVDRGVVQPAENGLETPIIPSKPPSLVGPTQSAGAKIYQQKKVECFIFA